MEIFYSECMNHVDFTFQCYQFNYQPFYLILCSFLSSAIFSLLHSIIIIRIFEIFRWRLVKPTRYNLPMLDFWKVILENPVTMPVTITPSITPFSSTMFFNLIVWNTKLTKNGSKFRLDLIRRNKCSHLTLAPYLASSYAYCCRFCLSP